MYACSPRWGSDWISRDDLHRVLAQLSGRIQPSPLGRDRVGINWGLHFTGGEPFLNFDLLVEAVRMAHDARIPSIFVETNSFWCIEDRETRQKLLQLKDAGLNGMLVSVNPFILERVPFERTARATKIAREVFVDNVMIYQQHFYSQFLRFGLKGTQPLEGYIEKTDPGDLCRRTELLPMGRACYALGHLFPRYPAEVFLDEPCLEELTRGWHVHVDNYCNYMTGYCGGLSLGDGRDIDSICRGINLDERPILNALVTSLRLLVELAVREFGYEKRKDGYISKCHLCVDVRRHIARATDEFQELRPREFYLHLE